MRLRLALIALTACAGDDGQATDDGGVDAATPRDAAADAPVDGDVTDAWPDLPEAPRAEVLVEGLVAPCGLVSGRDGLWVAEAGAGRVILVPSVGGPPEERAAELGEPWMLSLADDDSVLVTERAGGRVLRIDGAGVTVLAVGQSRPGRIRAVAGAAVWVDEGTGADDGAVRRVPLEGGDVQEVAASLAAPRGLAVLDGAVLFAEAAARRVVQVGAAGDSTELEDLDGTPVDVAADPETRDVFWMSAGSRGGGWLHRSDPLLATDDLVTFSPPGPSWLALGGDFVTWSTASTISRAPREAERTSKYEDVAVQVSVCDFVLEADAVTWTDPTTGRLLRMVLTDSTRR